MDARYDMRYTIRECGKGDIILCLENIPCDHAQLLMLSLTKALSDMEVGEVVLGRNRGETYEIVRVS